MALSHLSQLSHVFFLLFISTSGVWRSMLYRCQYAVDHVICHNPFCLSYLFFQCHNDKISLDSSWGFMWFWFTILVFGIIVCAWAVIRVIIIFYSLFAIKNCEKSLYEDMVWYNIIFAWEACDKNYRYSLLYKLGYRQWRTQDFYLRGADNGQIKKKFFTLSMTKEKTNQLCFVFIVARA